MRKFYSTLERMLRTSALCCAVLSVLIFFMVAMDSSECFTKPVYIFFAPLPALMAYALAHVSRYAGRCAALYTGRSTPVLAAACVPCPAGRPAPSRSVPFDEQATRRDLEIHCAHNAA